jgi:hypothetical protein
MKLRIDITKDILEQSKHCENFRRGQNCAIGRAIHNVFPFSVVGTDNIYFYKSHPYHGDNCTLIDGKQITTSELPIIARQFISMFDRTNAEGRVAMPEISFEIDVPQEIIDTIDISEVERIISETPHLNLVS